ncbi:MAG: triose-phosphate isomerase [Deltaproteobacteria bacterium CG11_big_fil_rev_8_21_14_0_20_49_13]|nr:MAG: triose-phosphate isomerase [Deltaproteobacteria bacterium CG11_big_fil_rev_8_21_14_0_20_49_13]
MPKFIVAANWKLNNTVQESLMLVAGIIAHVKLAPNVEVVLAPPFTSLYSVGVSLTDSELKLAGQNIYWEEKGAFTGEISGSLLKDIGCLYVLIGHSERRKYFGETNETVNKRIFAALRNELVPIMCIGETLQERESGKTYEILERQLKGGLMGLQQKDLEKFSIAYEPVWAIGTGKNATGDQIEEAHHFIRNYVAKLYDAPTANNISILYGGSVKASNCKEIYKQPNVNGVLVGGASLDAKGFCDMIAQTPGQK